MSKRWTSLPVKFKEQCRNHDVIIKDPLESQVQITVIQWANTVRYKQRHLSYYLHHSANGGNRSITDAQQFKEMGVQAGYPDLLLDIPKGGYHGLRIEIKRSKREKIKPHQQERIDALNEEGYLAVLCVGYDEIVDTIKDYMNEAYNEATTPV